MQNEQTPERRRAERNSALNDLLTACQAHCPDSPAMASAQLLSSSLRGGGDDVHKHARVMNLLESCVAQVQAGATELNLNPPRRQPTVDALRADLERDLPRGPNRR